MANEFIIKTGEYIVIQKQNYKKLHKYKPNSSVTLGRDTIKLSGIEGCRYFSVFKLIPSSKKGRQYQLELTEEAVDLKDEIDIRTSGTDNRNILDDGQSQKLTPAQIEELTNDSNKASDIVEVLISNSNTFHNKTEYSQEKYLKKKEKKYFEFIQILKPNLRIVTEVMYKLDPAKIQGVRIDTLSQIITMSNIHSEGHHLLYDSGSNGLLAAALLSAIGPKTNGTLIHMHPGNMSQKQALLSMNFGDEQSNRCISVNIYSVLRQIYQGCDTNSHVSETYSAEPNSLKRKADEQIQQKCKVPKHEDTQENTCEDVPIENEVINSNNEADKQFEPKNEVLGSIDEADKTTEHNTVVIDSHNEVHKQVELKNNVIDATNGVNKQTEPKKPKWHYDNIAASELLKQKVDSLVIASKEDPKNIFIELLPLVKAGRPFVIYNSVAEPLQHLYIELKSHSNVAALKLTCNWMRNYQILPERTHPEVMMNGQSGFLLTGYVLKS